jgi:hypothetical protein
MRHCEAGEWFWPAPWLLPQPTRPPGFARTEAYEPRDYEFIRARLDGRHHHQGSSGSGALSRLRKRNPNTPTNAIPYT